MSSSSTAQRPALSPPHYANPFALWAEAALKTSELLMSSASVIQLRTQRMACTAWPPEAADIDEFHLMGQEKFEAAVEVGAVVADELGVRQLALFERTVRHCRRSLDSWFALAASASPSEAVQRHDRWLRATGHAAASASRLGNAPARIAHDGVLPVHRRATDNARRLTLPPQPVSAA